MSEFSIKIFFQTFVGVGNGTIIGVIINHGFQYTYHHYINQKPIEQQRMTEGEGNFALHAWFGAHKQKRSWTNVTPNMERNY